MMYYYASFLAQHQGVVVIFSIVSKITSNDMSPITTLVSRVKEKIPGLSMMLYSRILTKEDFEGLTDRTSEHTSVVSKMILPLITSDMRFGLDNRV